MNSFARCLGLALLAGTPVIAQTVLLQGSEIGFTSRQMGVPMTLTALRLNCYDNPMLKREVCGGDFERTLRRSQWGENRGLQTGVADACKLILQLEAIKQ
jgi:hypothetical protein